MTSFQKQESCRYNSFV